MNKPMSVFDMLNSESFQTRIKQVLPEFLRPERVIGIAITELRNNPKLMECNALSLVGAIIRAGQVGLDIDSIKGHAFLVPYKKECQLVIGYKGMLSLAYASKKLLSIEVQPVYEKDEFRIEHGDNYGLTHKINPIRKERGKIIGYYAYAHLANGGKMFDYMDQEEIDEIKSCSKSSNYSNSPWVAFPIEMAKKTVVRRLCKYLSLSPYMEGAIGLDEMNDAGVQNEELQKIGREYVNEFLLKEDNNNSSSNNVPFAYERVNTVRPSNLEEKPIGEIMMSPKQRDELRSLFIKCKDNGLCGDEIKELTVKGSKITSNDYDKYSKIFNEALHTCQDIK